MLRRIIYLLLVTVFLGGLAGAIAYYAFEFKPKFLAEVIGSMPPPVETVSAEEVRTEEWQPQILAIGSLTAVNGIDITPEVGGVIKEIHFESGQTVKTGDKLVQLDTDTDEADLKNLEVQLANAETELGRTRKIAQKGFAAQADLDSAITRRDQLLASIERTKALIAQKSIFAPWDGRLGLRSIAVGQYVAPGQKLVWMQSVDPIFVDFTVTEAEFGRVRPGAKLHATFTAFPGETFEGEVFTTDARITQDSRMMTVRGKISNPDGRLVPGMYANVALAAGDPEPVITVPQNAITYTLYGDSVFVLVPPKGEQAGDAKDVLEVERRFIKPGAVRDGRVRVVEGLAAGERVVVAGQNKVDQGSRVRVDNSIALNAPADRMSQ
jgi:membrane fusion protein, multidrug efflux system